jgi:rubrerythrin
MIVAVPILNKLGEKDRRRVWLAHGLCPECGYSLTGNLSGICPECGSLAKPEATLPENSGP